MDSIDVVYIMKFSGSSCKGDDFDSILLPCSHRGYSRCGKIWSDPKAWPKKTVLGPIFLDYIRDHIMLI